MFERINEKLEKFLEFDRALFNEEPGYYDRKFGYDKQSDNSFSSDDKKTILEFEVKNIIKENNLSYDICSNDGDRIGIEVSGDWKHDHAYFNNLMRQHGFIKVDEESIGEETGDDSYTSIHYYSKEINEGINEDIEMNPDVLQRRENLGKAAEAEGLKATAIFGGNNSCMITFENLRMIDFDAVIYPDRPTKFGFKIPDGRWAQDDAIAICEDIAKVDRIIKSL